MKNSQFNCTICNNTRHVPINNFDSKRCSCLTRIWVNSQLTNVGIDPSFMNPFWARDNSIAVPQGCSEMELTVLRISGSIINRVLERGRLKKEIFFSTKSKDEGNFKENGYLYLTAYLAGSILAKRGIVRFFDISKLTENHFNGHEKITLGDLNFIYFGFEVTKNISSQLIFTLHSNAQRQNKNLIFICTLPFNGLSKEYPMLQPIISKGKVINF